MKNRIKKVLAIFLAMLMIFACTAMSFADDGNTIIRDVNDAYAAIKNIYVTEIYKATLYEKGDKTGTEVYVVLCNGLDPSETDMSQPRSILNAAKIMLSDENNTYVKQIVESVTAKVPSGENLVFIGFSMGGMVVQQAIANQVLKDNYEIISTLSIGAPYILTSKEKEGNLIRCVDNLDAVGLLSIPLLANPFIGNLQTETSFKVGLVHFKSYSEGSCWQKYDALGKYKGKGKEGTKIEFLSKIFAFEKE